MIKLDQFKVKGTKESSDHGIFEIGPLPRGFGHTLGNSLRRILLSSINGGAVTAIKIDGIKHEYATLEGLQEDIITLVLKLKELAIKVYADEPQKIKLNVKGKKGEVLVVKASDLELPSAVEIINGDLEIATLTKDINLKVEITVENGVGYSLADEDKRKEIGVIPVDSIFSPVKRVKMDVVQARVGQYTDLDQVNLEIFTNGTITPRESLLKSAEIYDELANRLVNQLGGDAKLAEQLLEQEKQQEVKEEKVLVSDLNLSTRLTNALLNAGIADLRELKTKSRDEVINFRGMGKKSITELDQIMTDHNISFKA